MCRADLSSLQLLLGQLHQAADLCGDAKVFEEALVRGPELSPQGLPADQAKLVSCLHEHLQRLRPLNTELRHQLRARDLCNRNLDK